MPQSEKSKWMVLYTHPRSERKSHDELKEQGFEVYMPLMTVMKQWSDRRKIVKEPMFKSYLFIRCTEKELVKATYYEHIVGYVRFDHRPAVVRESEIEIIRRVEAGKEEVMVVDASLATGQRVLVTSGYMKGVEGTLTEIRGAQMIAITIESLGCKLLIHAGKVKKIP